jgi:hypothetical protein
MISCYCLIILDDIPKADLVGYLSVTVLLLAWIEMGPGIHHPVTVDALSSLSSSFLGKMAWHYMWKIIFLAGFEALYVDRIKLMLMTGILTNIL